MPDVQAHPTQQMLTKFGLGQLTGTDSEILERHLSECEACRQVVEELPNDSLVNLIQSTSNTHADVALDGATPEPSIPPESASPLFKKLAQILGTNEQKAETTPATSVRFTPPRALEDHPRYDVTATLGAGGMGTVFQARHRVMDRTVALKMVNPLLIHRPGAAERFAREVKAAAKLMHPNIVAAYDAETVEGTQILVMEYVEGQTLAQALMECPTFPVAKACEYLRQTAIGLQHALDHGMVHRDIKPQNLMLTSKGVVKILDFGLARFTSNEGFGGNSTEHGTLMGSPDYMAPEQAADAHSADTRADVYSMGCTLYHLLAGQVPFPESAMLAKLEAHRDRDAIRLHRLRPDVPGELSDVVHKMMAKDPAKRFQTPLEVAKAHTCSAA